MINSRFPKFMEHIESGISHLVDRNMSRGKTKHFETGVCWQHKALERHKSLGNGCSLACPRRSLQERDSASGMKPLENYFTHILNEQAKHIAFVVAEVKKHGATTVETSEEAETEWVRTIIDLGKPREDFLKECTPSYYNDEGKVSEKTLKTSRYGLGSPVFIQLLEDWRKEGSLIGLELDGKTIKASPTVEAKALKPDVSKTNVVTVETAMAEEIVGNVV